MPKNLLLMLLLTVLSVAGCAKDSYPEATQKVDLSAVIQTGVVQPVDGISAAGQPDAAAFKVFAEQGYTTVIDLRAGDEDRGMDEAQVIENLGMEYIAMPIAEADEINFDNAAKLGELIDAADGPVLVHCASSNRVGALLALRESLHGADDEAALLYGTERGMTRLEGRVKEVFGKK